MWLPNSDELQYFKHYERDLINSVTKQPSLQRPRILAARDATSKSTWKKSLTALPRFVLAGLQRHSSRSEA